MYFAQRRQQFLGKSPPVDGDELVGSMSAAMWGQAVLDVDSQAGLLAGSMRAEMFGLAALDVPDTRVLPCLDFPYRVSESRELIASDARVGAPLVASSARRITRREVAIDWSMLDDAERIALLNVWQNGDGCFRRFAMTMPGEASPRWFVFRDAALRLNRLNAAVTGATVALLEVTRAGEEPS